MSEFEKLLADLEAVQEMHKAIPPEESEEDEEDEQTMQTIRFVLLPATKLPMVTAMATIPR